MGIVRSLFGASTPPLKPRGPAPFAQPAESDRRALFWWLKRNTSFTAMTHCAALWAQFVKEWEGWLRSQDSPYEYLVETFKYALDTQAYYERGLARLRQGDRGVFDARSPEGWLAKVNTGLPQRRMEWDDRVELVAQQDGVPISVLRSYYDAHNAAMASGRTTSYRGMGFPRMSARALLAALPFDTALPEPQWNVNFPPGGCSPKDGIYEMVGKDGHVVGAMQHFIKAEAASPEDFLEFGADAGNEHARAFHWRLLWEDVRYLDGQIPAEEQSYPVPGQVEWPADGLRLRCEANQPCVKAGFWFTPARPNSRRLFEQGETMPAVSGDYGTTIWQWDVNQEL